MCNSCPSQKKDASSKLSYKSLNNNFVFNTLKTSLYINKPLRYLFYVNTENNYYFQKIFIPYINVKSENNNFVMFVTLAVYDNVAKTRQFEDVLRINFPVGKEKVGQFFNEFSNGNYNHQIPDTVLFLNEVKKRITQIAEKKSKSTVKNILIQQSTKRFKFSDVNAKQGLKSENCSGCYCEDVNEGCVLCFGVCTNL